MNDQESMSLNEYLSQADFKEKILIVSDVSKGNALLRIFENREQKPVCNISCKSIDMLADTIYKYEQAKIGYDKGIEVLSNSEALMLFRNLVLFNCIDKKELSYFDNKDILDIATTSELFSKINLIRSNRWLPEIERMTEPRLKDVALLTTKYEQYLEDNNMADRISRIISITDIVKGWGDALSLELKCAFNAEFSCLMEDAEQFTGIQKEFTDLLCASNPPVSLCRQANTNDGQNEILENLKDKSAFFKGYGSFNEANYIAYDILKNQYPFGKTAVLYSSDRQLHAISSALRGNKIPMKIVSGYPAVENKIILLVKRIIDWANDNFSEQKLETLLSSSILKSINIKRQKKDGTEYEQNIVSFEYIQNARGRRTDNYTLGWGYERNLDFIQHEMGLATTDEMKSLLAMHQSLLDIFRLEDRNGYTADVIAERLVDFVSNYACNSDEEYAIGTGLLENIRASLQYEKNEYDLSEICSLFTDLLSSISYSEKEDASSVSVMNMHGWVPLERPYVYIIGLSLTEIQDSLAESPVLSDAEMESLPRTGFIPTIVNKSKIKETDLYRTLSTFTGNKAAFGYSYFDSVNHSMNNASSFYIKALKSIKGQNVNDVIEFVYGDDRPSQKYDPLSSERRIAFSDNEWPTSKSQLESLLSCPKQYAYSDYKVLGIPDSDYLEPDESSWMNAAQKGNYFHGIAEKYANELLHKPSTAQYDSIANETELRKIAEEIESEMINGIQPEIIAGMADIEKENLISAAVTYFTWLHDNLNETGWRVLKSELRFDKAIFEINDLLGNSYSFSVNGLFDRLDYKLDRNNKKIYLRIADYKTGKRKGQNDKLEKGILIQHTVYYEALKTGIFIKDKENNIAVPLSKYIVDEIVALEGDSDISNWAAPEFDSFTYEFPLEDIGKHQIVITKAEIETLASTRLKAILTFIKENDIYPDPFDLFKALTDETNGYIEKYKTTNPDLECLPDKIGQLSPDEERLKTDLCSYCCYKEFCAKWKAGDIYDV